MTEKPVRITFEATPALKDALDQVLAQDSHSTRSEFIRDAVRRRLEEMGYNFQIFSKKEIEK